MEAEKKREIYWLSIVTLIFGIGNFAAWKVMEYTACAAVVHACRAT